MQDAANKSLTQAGISTNQLTAVEAHASGFANEMSIESQGLQAITQGQTVTIDSAKRLFGHGFSASGMGAIYSQCIKS